MLACRDERHMQPMLCHDIFFKSDAGISTSLLMRHGIRGLGFTIDSRL